MCIYPIRKCYTVENGKIKIDWKSSGIDKNGPGLEIMIPCGKCQECQKRISRDWALRIMLESKKYKENCMITLTYKKTNGELVKRDIQLFIKNLRRQLDYHYEGRQIKVFYCGEYGKRGGRPHFHLIVMGWMPNDLEFFKNYKGHKLFLSPFVSKIWKKGYISVEELTYENAFYSTLYLQKYNNVSEKETKPFRHMSKGLAQYYLDKIDLHTGIIYFNGKSFPLPSYFKKKLKDNPEYQKLKEIQVRDYKKLELPFPVKMEKLENDIEILANFVQSAQKK